MSNNLDDYLKTGMHGVKEIGKEQRDIFLGTLRERIYVTLSVGQTMRKMPYREVDVALKRANSALLLNGNLPYGALSSYVQMANRNSRPFTIVHPEKDTPIGLVVTSDTAVDEETITITDDLLHAKA
ncbi:MAG: YueI family protein [Bacilli bacterium]